jgi:tetratricopeptide (TPR) repeat protein
MATRKGTTMSTKRRTIVLLLVLIWIVPGLAFAARKARVIGKLIDPDGKAIAGVSVTATSPDLPKFREIRTTDKKGVFILDFEQVGVAYQYRFEKVGYQLLEVQQKWDLEGTEHFEWTMQLGSTAAAADAPIASASQPAVLAYNAGVGALKAKDYATAEAKFKEAVGHDPNLRQGWGALSSAQLELGRHQEAAAAAEKAIALGSTDEAVFMARWQAYKNLGDEAKAAEALKDLEATGRRAEEAKRLHNEAVALVKAGDDACAFAKFQEALALDPNLQESLIGLGTAGVKLGRNAEASAAAETILKADPDNEKALRIRYNACLKLGDEEKLLDALVGLAPVEPKIARDGILKLAFDAYDRNELETAKTRFLKVLELDPNQPQAHYYIGVISASQGAKEDAKKYLERFLQLAPNDPEANSAREMLKYLSKR